MIKIIPDFLPSPLFKYIKEVLENENTMLWNFNPNKLKQQTNTNDGNDYKIGKLLYCDPRLTENQQEHYDKELMPIFGVFKTYMMEHMQEECKDEKNGAKLIRMKMNLYPSHIKQIDHGIHNDVWQRTNTGRQPDPNVVTSVFNFTTCNGSTTLLDKDEQGKYTKKVVAPSIENTMVMFNNPHPHFGTTQNDSTARMVLNTNISKSYVDTTSKSPEDYF